MLFPSPPIIVDTIEPAPIDEFQAPNIDAPISS